jgi:hypothetical protein
MKVRQLADEEGNVLVCALCTILVVSMLGSTVLLNCTTRYNVVSSQVQSWKAALSAAEAGGDIAYSQVRKTVLDPLHAFAGWSVLGTVHTGSVVTLVNNILSTSSTVDSFYTDPVTGNPWYRIRSKGTATITGLRRTGMDDRMLTGAKGDSLLRKIDFQYDHFIAAFGPNGDNLLKALVPVSGPQITRRIELIAAPVTPFEAAVKCASAFNGPGSAGWVDSYNSNNGPYYFAANNPADPHYSDSRSGSVEVGTASFSQGGTIYGNVSTNGGNVKPSSSIQGVIDNNVPFTIPSFILPTTLPLPQLLPAAVIGNVTINPLVAGTPITPTFYLLSSFTGNLKINQAGSAQTYVAIHVTSDITGSIDIAPGVHAQIYFDGNINVKASSIVNESGIAGNLQFYGVSPIDPSISQSINIGSPGNFAATFYAPSADFTMTGNPDVTGAVVCKTFSGNGNTSWHYDRALATIGNAIDYRIASYVEDIR